MRFPFRLLTLCRRGRWTRCERDDRFEKKLCWRNENSLNDLRGKLWRIGRCVNRFSEEKQDRNQGEYSAETTAKVPGTKNSLPQPTEV